MENNSQLTFWWGKTFFTQKCCTQGLMKYFSSWQQAFRPKIIPAKFHLSKVHLEQTNVFSCLNNTKCVTARLCCHESIRKTLEVLKWCLHGIYLGQNISYGVILDVSTNDTAQRTQALDTRYVVWQLTQFSCVPNSLAIFFFCMKPATERMAAFFIKTFKVSWRALSPSKQQLQRAFEIETSERYTF